MISVIKICLRFGAAAATPGHKAPLGTSEGIFNSSLKPITPYFIQKGSAQVLFTAAEGVFCTSLLLFTPYFIEKSTS